MGQDGPVDLDTIAHELYGLKPSEFTSTRDARAAEARREGDKALAADVKKLRRPTTGAWLANLLARERHDQVDRLLDLGASLRQAQEELATGDLRRLSSERHRLLAELEKEARELGRGQGQSVGDAAAQELAATLEAALADEEAAAALRAGRLTSGLHYSGLGLMGFRQDRDEGPDGSGGGPGGPTGAQRSEAPSHGSEGPSRGRAHRAPGPAAPGTGQRHQLRPAARPPTRQERDAELAVKTAEAALAAADREATARRAHLGRTRDERDRRRADIADLEGRLRALREAEDEAEGDARAAEQAVEAADRRVLAAQDELARARAVLADR